MRAVIIGNGSFYDGFKFLKDDFFICADGGFNHANEHGIKPDIIIGDMDSVTIDIKEQNTVIYPTEKDFTDGELAVDEALNRGFKEIILLSMTGSRLDHTIANITLLKKISEAGAFGKIVDGKNEIYYIKHRLSLKNMKGKTVSLIPLGGNLDKVSNFGFYYPLNNETLFYGTTRGISNVIVNDDAGITAEAGEGIVVVTNGE